MADKKNYFFPAWRETPPLKGSFRSIFKFGNPGGFKHPNKRFYEELKQFFHLSDNDFKILETTGDEIVGANLATPLSSEHVEALRLIVGDENISAGFYDRLKYSTGQSVQEAMNLRLGRTGPVADLVVHPRSKDDVHGIISYCSKKLLPVYVYGGGSSVNFGLTPVKGGITLVLSSHLNKVVEFSEINQTVTVEAGIMGPQLEELLNKAPERFGAGRRFTCGHFPQSFECSTVGGWIVTLGSGQQSSYYGDAANLVMSLEIVTPSGILRTYNFPAAATGPDLASLFKGSEGVFGVVVEVTWRIFRYNPANRQYFSFIFPEWESAVEAGREISQGEFGMPAVFRISDQEETHHGLKIYGIEGTVFDRMMKVRGFKPKERCLFIGTADGEKHFTVNIKRQVKKICRRYGAMYLTALPARKWEKSRFSDPHLREDLMDFGFIIDTLETSVRWDNLHRVYKGVKDFMKQQREVICLTHASHFYAQGTNLYFIFIIRENSVERYSEFQQGIISAIVENGGSLSHHHGIGRLMGNRFENYLGREQMDVIRTLKKHFDPNGIINPGGQLGLP